MKPCIVLIEPLDMRHIVEQTPVRRSERIMKMKRATQPSEKIPKPIICKSVAKPGKSILNVAGKRGRSKSVTFDRSIDVAKPAKSILNVAGKRDRSKSVTFESKF